MYLSAIVLAAGRGTRFNSRTPKPLAKIDSKAIISYSLKTISEHPSVKDIIVVVNPKNSKSIIEEINRYRINKISRIVLGGRRRQDSVFNALSAIGKKTDLVLIHDAVRPFMDRKLVSALIREAEKEGAAITGVPVKATIKEVYSSQFTVRSKFVVKRTLNRDNLWEVQTPQVFRKNLIQQAYKKFGHLDVTDDSMLVEKLGAKVSVVLGYYNNIKITTPEDLLLAKVIAKKWNTK